MAKYSVEQWIKRATAVHGDKYDYTYWFKIPDKIRSSNRVPIICREHGRFFQILDNHVRGKGCPVCGHEKRAHSNRKHKSDYIERCVNVHGDYYDYNLVPEFPTDHIKVPIICPLHGRFEQRLYSHVNGNGCPKCATHRRTQTLIQKYGVRSPRQLSGELNAFKKLQDKEWVYHQYVENNHTTSSLADLINVNAQTVANHIHHHQIEINHTWGTSRGEQELIDFCSKYATVETNSRKIIPPKEIDIFLPEYNIAIEYCGLYWHSEQNGKDKHYHKDKMEKCASLGIRLITLYEDEWINHRDIVQRKILYLLNRDSRKKISARETEVRVVDNKMRKIFLETNHIQGNGPGSINLGLYSSDTLVACASFIKEGDGYQLTRFASSANVRGGFSKIIAHFSRQYKYNYLTTFADLRWSDGELYKQNGWTDVKHIPPDYYYVLPGGKKRIHKFNYRRKYLPNLLKKFNPRLSEKQNCDNNGLLRVWDCGKIKYQLQYNNEKT